MPPTSVYIYVCNELAIKCYFSMPNKAHKSSFDNFMFLTIVCYSKFDK